MVEGPLTAIGLTVALALLVLSSFTLIVIGPTLAEHLASSLGLGPVFEWAWKILQWPLAFALVSTAVGLVYLLRSGRGAGLVLDTRAPSSAHCSRCSSHWRSSSPSRTSRITTPPMGGGRRDRTPAVVLHLRPRDPRGRRTERGDRARLARMARTRGKKVPGEKKKIGAAAARAYRQRLEAAPDARYGYCTEACSCIPGDERLPADRQNRSSRWGAHCCAS